MTQNNPYMKRFLFFFTFLNLLYPAYSQNSGIVIYDPPPHKGVYMGMYTLDGKEVLSAKYGYFQPINDKLIHIINLEGDQRMHGVIDYKGKDVIPSIYNNISGFAEKYLVTSVKLKEQTSDEGAKYSYEITNLLGKVLSEKFDQINIYQNYCIVQKDGQYAILDKRLNYVTPYTNRYSSIISWDWADSLFVAEDRITGKSALITPIQKNITPFIYDKIVRYRRSEKRGDKGIPDNYYTIESDRKYGALDLSGQLIIPAKYDNIVRINDSIFFVNKGKSDYSWGIFNTNNPEEEVIPCRYDIRDRIIRDNYVFLKDSVSKAVVYTLSGKEVIPGDNYMKPLQNGYWETSSDYHLWGVVDNYNQEILPCKYHSVDSLSSSLFLTGINGKSGVADFKGNIILPNDYDSVKVDNGCNLLMAYKDKERQYFNFNGDLFKGKLTCQPTVKRVGDKYLIFDADGNTNDILYDDTKWNRDNLAWKRNGRLIVVEGYHFGVINESGDILIPTKYRMIEPGDKGNSFNVCDTDNVWHLFTEKDGIYINSGEIAYKNYNEQDMEKKKDFIHIHPITDKIYEVTFEDGKHGLANADMKVITTARYDWISTLDKDLFLVENGEENEKRGILNSKGKEIVPVKYSWIELESANGIDYLKAVIDTKKNSE